MTCTASAGLNHDGLLPSLISVPFKTQIDMYSRQKHMQGLRSEIWVFTYPNSMKNKGKALSWKSVPVAESIHYSSLRAHTQLARIKESWWQLQQSLMGSVVIDQLSHLQNNKDWTIFNKGEVLWWRAWEVVPYHRIWTEPLIYCFIHSCSITQLGFPGFSGVGILQWS